VAGVDPDIMGIGPVPASRQALRRAGLGIQELDLVEINEAFAAQYLAVERELGLDREKSNVIRWRGRRRGRFGLASLCIGGGQGIAMVVEALHD
jgi:acetyl-CoA C-acetyltransferase